MNSLIAIGIDLGTCYTKAGVFTENPNEFQVIEISSKRDILNYVAFKPSGRETGENVKAKIRMNYNKMLFDSKKFIGSGYDTNQIVKNRYPFKINEDEQNKFQFQIVIVIRIDWFNIFFMLI